MKNDVPINQEIIIPAHELDITTSRAGGPGGQHVQKTATRISVRWNVKATQVLSEEQKERVLRNLQSRLTSEGDLIIHNATSRSQQQNKKLALEQLAREIRKALYVPKKRTATKISQAVKESRLQKKAQRSDIKKMRRKVHHDE
jgi:ribosome-associated protein